MKHGKLYRKYIKLICDFEYKHGKIPEPRYFYLPVKVYQEIERAYIDDGILATTLHDNPYYQNFRFCGVWITPCKELKIKPYLANRTSPVS